MLCTIKDKATDHKKALSDGSRKKKSPAVRNLKQAWFDLLARHTQKNEAIEAQLELVSDRQAAMFLQRKQMVCLRTFGAKSDDSRENYVRVHGNDFDANFSGASRAKESLLIDIRTSPVGLNCVLTDVWL